MSRAISLLFSVADGTVRRCMVGALLVVIACAALAGTAPVLLKLSVDRLAASQADAAYLVPIILIALYAGALWLVRILQELRVSLYGRADQRIQRSISSHLLAHTLSLPFEYHVNREVGALVLTLNNGLLGCRIVTQHLVLSLLPVLLEIGTITAVLVALDQKLFLLVIYGMLLCYGAVLFVGMNRLGKAARAATSSQVQAGGLLTDTILNYEAIKIYGADCLVGKRFSTALATTEKQWGIFFSKKLRFGLVAATVFAIGFCLSLSLAARKVADGTLSIGEFVLVQTYVLQLVLSFELFGFAMRDISQGTAYLGQLQELLAEHPEDGPSVAGRVINSTCTGELAFEAVSFSHDKRASVLSNISFSIPPGSTIAVVGPTGSGKSSLLRLILRFHEPNSGRILLDKVPISDIPLPALRRCIALVPQDIALFNESIAFNVAIGEPESTPEQIQEAAEAALLGNFSAAQWSGFDGKVGERGSKLSGGERQRIAIARALLKRPHILLLDEATSALDPATERKIWQNIRDWLCGSTSLIVAHRLSTVVDADEIFVLDSGRIVERGTHSALVHAGGIYASMWRAQQRQTMSSA